MLFLKNFIDMKWLGFFLVSSFAIFQFLLQGSVGILAPNFKQAFNIDAAAIGILSSSFYYSYILMQIPAGMIYDLFGIRKVSTISIAIVSLSCLLMAFAKSFAFAVFCRILMGFGCSFGFIGVLTYVKRGFENKNFALIAAIAECLSMVGVALANTALSKVILSFGWRVSLGVCSFFAALLSATIFFVLHHSLSEKESLDEPFQTLNEPTPLKKNTNVLGELLQMARKRDIWIAGIYSALTFSVITVFAALWAIPYLEKAYNMPLVTATSIISFTYVGVAVASPIIGWAASYVKIPSLMSAGSTCSLIILLIMFNFRDLSVWTLYLLTFLLGFSCSVYQLSFPIVSQMVSSKSQGTAMGFNNMVTMLSAPILQPLVGILISLSQGGVFDKNETYSAGAYIRALSILPISLAIASILCMGLKHEHAITLRQLLSKYMRMLRNN